MKRFDDVFQTLPSRGWLTEDEARLLWLSASKVKGPYLEVGCFHGRSSVLLAQLCFPEKLHCVDPFKGFSTEDPKGNDTRKEFMRNMNERRIHNFILHQMKIEVWAPRHVNFAYLDGDHTAEGTKEQIMKALQCDPSIIAIHDVNDSGDGLAIKETALRILGPWNERVERLAVWEITQERLSKVA